MTASTHSERSALLPTAGADTEADDRWNVVRNRDKGFDGQFVYAVRTTGIYCRPSCAARLPRRQNVRFFDSGIQARAAGFRACKRCTPDADGRRTSEPTPCSRRAGRSSKAHRALPWARWLARPA